MAGCSVDDPAAKREMDLIQSTIGTANAGCGSLLAKADKLEMRRTEGLQRTGVMGFWVRGALAIHTSTLWSRKYMSKLMPAADCDLQYRQSTFVHSPRYLRQKKQSHERAQGYILSLELYNRKHGVAAACCQE